jgi:amidase
MTRSPGRVASGLPGAPAVVSLPLAEDLLALADEPVAAALAGAAADIAAASGLLLGSGQLTTRGARGMVTAFRAVQGAEAWAADGGWVTAHSGVLGPGIAQRVADGAAMTVEQLSGARAVSPRGTRPWPRGSPRAPPSCCPHSSTARRWPRHPSARPTDRAATLRLTCLAGSPACRSPSPRLRWSPATWWVWPCSGRPALTPRSPGCSPAGTGC